MTQTIQQQRAAFALERVKGLAQTLKAEEQKEFISYASGLPAMIHMNGLGQAMAFCKVKGKDRKSYDQLYQLVSDWLCKAGQPYAGKAHVLDGIIQSDMAHYQLAQAEALVLTSWVKKFAKAFLVEDAA
jgi:CRISPR-associated protein Cmr5